MDHVKLAGTVYLSQFLDPNGDRFQSPYRARTIGRLLTVCKKSSMIFAAPFYNSLPPYICLDFVVRWTFPLFSKS
jgi:hypothetical protein